MTDGKFKELEMIKEIQAEGPQFAEPGQLRLAFGRRLRALRHHRVMSQRVLAKTSNVSMNTIGSIERGLRFPSPEVLESLSRALQVEVREMFEIENHRAPVTLEGAARELCRVVNDEMLPRIEHLTSLANRLLNQVEHKVAEIEGVEISSTPASSNGESKPAATV